MDKEALERRLAAIFEEAEEAGIHLDSKPERVPVKAPLQTRFGNDALLLGEKNCFFPKSQRLAEVIGENAQGAGKRLPGF